MKPVEDTLPSKSEEKVEDHRIRVAADRRQRMRVRLQNAIIACYVAGPTFRLPSVEEVCGEARVSRATFYRHFDSVESALDIIGQSLLEEMFNDLAGLFGRRHKPIEHIAMGIQMFLMRSATDSVWAAFASRAIAFTEASSFVRGILTDLDDLHEAGIGHMLNVDAAKSLILGATMEGIRHVHQTGDRRREYVEDLTTLILCALGIDLETAVEHVRSSSIHIRGLALDCLDWWRDPWS